MNAMCSSDSVTVVQDKHVSVVATGTILAHEVGHLFNMMHDTGEPYGLTKLFY